MFVWRKTHSRLTIHLIPLNHHLKLLVDLGVLGLCAWRQLVLCFRFGTVRAHHSVLMLLLIKCLQVSVDQLKVIRLLAGGRSHTRSTITHTANKQTCTQRAAHLNTRWRRNIKGGGACTLSKL